MYNSNGIISSDAQAMWHQDCTLDVIRLGKYIVSKWYILIFIFALFFYICRVCLHSQGGRKEWCLQLWSGSSRVDHGATSRGRLWRWRWHSPVVEKDHLRLQGTRRRDLGFEAEHGPDKRGYARFLRSPAMCTRKQHREAYNARSGANAVGVPSPCSRRASISTFFFLKLK